jgi:hypothetical protein
MNRTALATVFTVTFTAFGVPPAHAQAPRRRHEAFTYGYLRSDAAVTVSSGPYIEIVPVEAAYIAIPVYDPLVVFAAPRPGIVVRTALTYRFGARLGVAFAPWGCSNNTV